MSNVSASNDNNENNSEINEDDYVLETHDTVISIKNNNIKNETVQIDDDPKNKQTKESNKIVPTDKSNNEIEDDKKTMDMSTIELSKLSDEKITKYFLDKYADLEKKLNNIEKIHKKNQTKKALKLLKCNKENELDDPIYEYKVDFGINFDICVIVLLSFTMFMIYLFASTFKLNNKNELRHIFIFIIFLIFIVPSLIFVPKV